VDRCALFVDASYVLADGAMAVHGTRRRDSVTWDYAGLLQLLSTLATERSGLPLLRCYWYESASDGRRLADHDALADMPGVKLRLVKSRPGQNGVEAEMHRDLTALARNQAVSDAMVVSSAEELTQVVADVQNLGMRVTLLHLAADGQWTISRTLRQECDDIVEISTAYLRPYVDLISGAEPSRDDDYVGGALSPYPRSNGNGHVPGSRTMTYAPMLPASLPPSNGGYSGNGHSGHGYQGPPAIYPAPVRTAQQSILPATHQLPAAPLRGGPQGDWSGQQADQQGGTQQAGQAGVQQPAVQQEFPAPPAPAAAPAPAAPPASAPAAPAPAPAVSQSPAAPDKPTADDLFAGLAAMPVKRPETPDAAENQPEAAEPSPESGQGQFGRNQLPSRDQRRHRGDQMPSRAKQFASRIEQLSTPLPPRTNQSPQSAPPLPSREGQQLPARQDPPAAPQDAPVLPDRVPSASAQQELPVRPEPPRSSGPLPAAPDSADADNLSFPPFPGELPARAEQSRQAVQPVQTVQAEQPVQPSFHAPRAPQELYSAPVAEAAPPAPPAPVHAPAPPPVAQERHSGGFPAARHDLSGYAPGGMRAEEGELTHPGSGSAQVHYLPTRDAGYAASDEDAAPPPPARRTGAHATAQSGADQADSSARMGSVTPFPPSYSPAGGGSYGGPQPAVPQEQPADGPFGNDAPSAGAPATGVPGVVEANGSAPYPVTGQNIADLNALAEHAPDVRAPIPHVLGGPDAPGASGQAMPTRGDLGQPGYEQPGYERPGYEQPGYERPRYEQPGYEQAGYGQPGPERAEYVQPEYGEQPGYGQPEYGQPEYGQPDYGGHPEYGHPEYGQPEYEQPGGGTAGAALPGSVPGAVPENPGNAGAPASLGGGAAPGPAPQAGVANPSSLSLADAVQSAHDEGQGFGGSVARDAPALWLEAVLARKPRMPSDLEARLLQGSSLPIDFLLHDEVRHALRRGFWDALERARR
jgi:hypothetical protein